MIATFGRSAPSPSTTTELSSMPATLTAEPIRDDAEYNGLRMRFGQPSAAPTFEMQIDIGFGNAIEPAPIEVQYPTLFERTGPQYPRLSA